MARWKFFETASRGDVLASWGERLARLGKTLGIDTWVKGLLWPAIVSAYAATSHIRGQWSWWIAIPLALVAATYALKLYAALRTASTVRGLKTLDLEKIGRDCTSFRTDVMEFLVARVDAGPGRTATASVSEAPSANTMYADWARNVDYSTQTRGRAVQKFAHRALAISHLLESTGIKPPNLWVFDINIANVAAYIGAVGELLERGLLKEARLMNPAHNYHLRTHLG